MIKRMLVILFTVIFAASPFIPFFAAYGSEGQTAAKDIALRDTFELGYYPQSRVTDSGLLAELNAIETEMTDYGFKQLPLTENRKLDMSFADVEYNGERYRKVYFGDYRIHYTKTSEMESSVQYLHGYSRGNYYWFKWEPIKWRVMTVGESDVTAYSKLCLDYRHYHSGDMAYWESCDLRDWLNGEFYNLAFSEENKTAITEKEIENKNNRYSAASGGNNTEDRVWLLSYYEMTEENGFVKNIHYDLEKEEYAVGSDYSYMLGLGSTQTSYNAAYFLRDVGSDNTTVCRDCSFFSTSILNSPFGRERGKNAVPVSAISGVLPVIAIDKKAVVTNSTLPEPSQGGENAPSADDEGTDVKDDETPKTPKPADYGKAEECRHAKLVKTVKKRADFSNDGTVVYKCKSCSKEIRKQTVAALKSVKLDCREYTYNGSAISPVITVKNTKCGAVKTDSYSVKYINRKNNNKISSVKTVGQYKAVITFKGEYSGEKTLYFSVKQSAPKIKACKKAKNGLKIYWKKSRPAGEYQFLVADNKKFKNAKTYKASAKRSAKLIKKLKKGKRYYIKIRSCKTIKVDKRKAYMYSDWSKIKTVKS